MSRSKNTKRRRPGAIVKHFHNGLTISYAGQYQGRTRAWVVLLRPGNAAFAGASLAVTLSGPWNYTAAEREALSRSLQIDLVIP